MNKIKKRIEIGLLSSLCLICAVGAVACGETENSGDKNSMNAIYIDSEKGNDNNSGDTEKTAYKSFDPLSQRDVVEPGTTIYLNGSFKGTLGFTGSGTEQEPIVITSLNKNTPAVIDGDSGGCSISIDGQSYITIDNLDITLQAQEMMARNAIFVTAEEGIVSGITIQNCNIHDVHGTHLSMMAAQDYWNSFYASAAIGFRYLKEKTDENNKFDKVTIKNCNIENILGCGIRFHDLGKDSTDEYANAFFSNVVIEDTTIDTTSADGILFQNCYKPIVRRCKVFRVGVLEPEGSDNYHAAVWACATESPLYEYNEVAYTKYVGGDGQAFDMDWGSKGISIWQYNYTHDNEGGVVLRHRDYNGIYRYNISVNDGSKSIGRGIVFHSSPNDPEVKEKMYFYNNVFYCDDTVDLQISYAFTGYPNWGKFSTELNVFKNNIFVYSNKDVTWGKNQYENNCYYCLSGENAIPTQDLLAIKMDPGFANTFVVPDSREKAAEIFSLKEDSPCFGKAKELTEVEKYLFDNKNYKGEVIINKNVGAI